MKKFFKSFLTLLVLLIGVGTNAWADVVSVTTENAQAALDAASEGATIELSAGNYDVLYLRNTGTAQSNRIVKDVTIKAASGATVNVAQIAYQKVTGKYLDIENLTIDGITFNVPEKSAVLFDVDGNGPRINGLTVQNCVKVGNNSQGSTYDNAAFVGMYYDGTTAIGATYAGDNTLTRGYHNIKVLNNTITNVFQPIKFPNEGPLYGLTVTGNTFTGCQDNHMMLSTKTTGTVTISNNTIVGMTGRFARISGAQSNAVFTLSDNTVKSPKKYDTGDDGSIFKITGTAGFTVTDSNNGWAAGTFTDAPTNTTWIAMGDAEKLYVAKIEETGVKYTTLAEAIAAVPATGKRTITLLDNIQASSFTIAYGQEVVLELNGKTLSGSAAIAGTSQLIYNKGILTIQDNTDTNANGGGNGKITNVALKPDLTPIPGYASNTILNRGTLTLKSGRVENTTLEGSAAFTIDNQTLWYDNMDQVTFNMEGGYVYRPVGIALAMRMSENTLGGNPVVNNVNISGGIVESSTYPFWVQIASGTPTGQLSITGGTFLSESADKAAFLDTKYGSGTWDNVSYHIENAFFKGEVRSEAKKNFLYSGYYSVKGNNDFVVEGKRFIANTAASTKDEYPWTIGVPAVAKIGEVTYPTLADAIAAVTTNDPTLITMIGDETITTANGVTIATGRNITIDLDGHDITANLTNTLACAVFNIVAGATLTMQDANHTNADCGQVILASSTVGNWPNPNVATNVFTNNGTLIIKGGYYENTGNGNCCYVVDNSSNTGNAALTVDGGKLVAKYSPIRTFLNNENLTNAVTINGGDFAGRFLAYFQQPSANISSPLNCTVNDCTFDVVGTNPAHIFYFELNNEGEINFALNGGKYKGYDSKYFVCLDTNGNDSYLANKNVTITGGVYTNKNIATPITVNAVDNTDEATKTEYPYTVKKEVAQIGDVKYASIAEAFAAVPADGTATITMIADDAFSFDVNSYATINAGQNITLDLNGKKVISGTTKESGTQVFLNNGTFTVMDSQTGGSITHGADPAWIYDGSGDFAGSYVSNIITNYGTLTVNSGTLKNISKGSASFVIDNSNNGGRDVVATINGDSLLARASAIRMFCLSTTLNNEVNITDGYIKGGAALYVQLPGDSGAKKLAKVNISGGTFEGSYGLYVSTHGDSCDSVKCTVSGGTFNNVYYPILCYGGTLKVSGGTFTSTGEYYSYITNTNATIEGGEFNGGDTGYGLYVESSNLDITGGEINGYYGLVASESDVNIDGGTFDYSYISNKTSEKEVHITNGTFNDHVQVYVSDVTKATVSGGRYGQDLIIQDAGENGLPVISGGVFTYDHYGESEVPDMKWNEEIADGYLKISNTDPETKDAYPYTVGKAVAQIGDVKYPTLQAAIAAVPEDGTETLITMIADEDINVTTSALTVAATKKIVLDLNGKKVQGNCDSGTSSALITNYGTLTIKDTAGEGLLVAGADPTWEYDYSGDYSGSYASNLITNCGNVTVENGTLKNVSKGSAAYVIDNNSTSYSISATVNGGTLEATANAAIRMYMNSTTNENNVVINDGYLQATYYAVSVQANNNTNKGHLTINGGEFEATASSWNCSVACWTASENLSIDITGGRFNDNVCIAKDVNTAISGGLYATKSFYDEDDKITYRLEDDVVAGKTVISNPDEATKEKYPWTIGNKEVAQIGDVKYPTIQAAVDAATEGETVVVIADVAVSEYVKIGKSIDIDLNGHTITGPAESDKSYVFVYEFYDVANPSVRISGSVYNGTINCNKIGVYSANHADVTVKDLTIVQTKTDDKTNFNHSALAASYGSTLTVNSGSYTGNYAAGIFNTGGTIIVNGGTLTGSEHAFDVYTPTSEESESNSLVLVTNGRIAGDVNIHSGTGHNGYTASVSLVGGIYSIKPDTTHIAYGRAAVHNTDYGTKEAYPWTLELAEVKVEEKKDAEGHSEVVITREDHQEKTEEDTEAVENTLDNPTVSGKTGTNVEQGTQTKRDEVEEKADAGSIDSQVKITLESATTVTKTISSAAMQVVNEMVFDVKPVVTYTTTEKTQEGTVTTTHSEQVSHTDVPVTFRLPIDMNMVAAGSTAVEVFHRTDEAKAAGTAASSIGVYPILTENNDNYVELTAQDFSEYSYKHTESALTKATVYYSVGGVKNTATIDATVDAFNEWKTKNTSAVNAILLTTTDILSGAAEGTVNNIVYDNGSQKTATKVVLTDGYDYYAPFEYTANQITYTRKFPENIWQAVCLPFTVTALPNATDKSATLYQALLPVGEKYAYAIQAVVDTEINKEANKPFIFKAGTASAVTFSETNALVKSTDALITPNCATTMQDFDFVGVYGLTNMYQAKGWYLTTSGGFSWDDTGVYNINLKAFRFYMYIYERYNKPASYYPVLSVTDSNIKLDVFGDEETDIEEIDVESDVDVIDNSNNAIYNLGGQKLEKLHKGINIVNGKKIFVK